MTFFIWVLCFKHERAAFGRRTALSDISVRDALFFADSGYARKFLALDGFEQRAAAEAHGLTDRVIFAGVQSDVPAFMNAFDLFLLPSNFEGSPVTLVEAQGCGVPCLASTNVPDDGSVTDLVHFLPLAAPLTDWAAKAEAIAAHGDHDDHWAALSAAGYELKTAARRMEQLYDKLGGHA